MESAPRRNWLSNCTDGVNLDDATILRRTDKCRVVFEALNNQAVRILRSPPGSGKSSLAMLLQATGCPRAVTVIDLSFWDVRRDTLDIFWERKFKLPIRAFLDPTEGEDRTFIIDEAQKTFHLGRDHSFWEAVKSINLVKPQHGSRVQVLLLGVYCVFSPPGSGSVPLFATPVDIHDAWSLSFLSLDDDEIVELFYAYNATCSEYLRPPVPISLQNTMCHLCGSHVGLLHYALVRYASIFRDHSVAISKSEEAAFIREHLLKLGFGEKLRSLPELDELSPQYAYWLRQAALRGPDGYLVITNSDSSLAKLIGAGVFDYDVTSRYLRFSSPLMQSSALRQLFGSRSCSPIEVTASMTAIDVAREVVLRLDRRTLRESLSTTAIGTLLERQYQMSFFRYVLQSLSLY
jgi:hypothetical protein